MLLGLTGAAAIDLTTRMTSDRGYVVLARGLDEPTAKTIRDGLAAGTLAGLSLEAEPERVYPLAGGSARLDARRAAPRLRQPRGRGPVRRRGALPEGAGRPAQGRRRPSARRVRRPGPGHASSSSRRASRGRPPPHDRRRPPARSSSRSSWRPGWPTGRSACRRVVMDPYTGEIYAEATYPWYDANDYAAIAAHDPERFIDPVVSTVYEPGLGLQDAARRWPGSRTGRSSRRRRINDSGRSRSTTAQRRSTTPTSRAMGWMPFEDIVAYSRNVGRRQGRPRARPTRPRRPRRSSTTRGSSSASASPTGIDVAGEVRRPRQRPDDHPVAPDRPRQRLVRPGRRRHPDPARDGLQRDGQRRDAAVQPHVVARGRRPAGRRAGPRPGHRRRDVGPDGRPDEPRRHDRRLSTATARSCPATSWVARPAPPRSGTRRPSDGKGAWKDDVFNYSFVGFIGKGRPQLVVAVRIHEATPTVVRPRASCADAGHVVRAVPPRRHRRDDDAWTCRRPAGPPAPTAVTGERAAYATTSRRA